MVYMGYYGKVSDSFQHGFLNYKRKVELSRFKDGGGEWSRR
jgi:hypothetical protein